MSITAERIKKLRLRDHLSQSQLARKLQPYIGRSRNNPDGVLLDNHNGINYISRIENDANNLGIQTLAAFSKIFNVSTDYLLGLTDVYWKDYKYSIEHLGLSNDAIELLRHYNNRYHNFNENRSLNITEFLHIQSYELKAINLILSDTQFINSVAEQIRMFLECINRDYYNGENKQIRDEIRSSLNLLSRKCSIAFEELLNRFNGKLMVYCDEHRNLPLYAEQPMLIE